MIRTGPQLPRPSCTIEHIYVHQYNQAQEVADQCGSRCLHPNFVIKDPRKKNSIQNVTFCNTPPLTPHLCLKPRQEGRRPGWRWEAEVINNKAPGGRIMLSTSEQLHLMGKIDFKRQQNFKLASSQLGQTCEPWLLLLPSKNVKFSFPF